MIKVIRPSQQYTEIRVYDMDLKQWEQLFSVIFFDCILDKLPLV